MNELVDNNPGTSGTYTEVDVSHQEVIRKHLDYMSSKNIKIPIQLHKLPNIYVLVT